MIKKILLSFSLVFGTAAVAQQGTASPYSFYGVGDQNSNITNEYKAMGGTSVYSDSIHLNLKNPATLGSLQKTTFSLGATSKFYDFKSDHTSDNVKRQTLDYVALGFPLINEKLGVMFGLLPYSNVGYKMTGLHTNAEGRITTNSYEGDGGVNKVFLALGYKVMPNLQVGIDAGYNFGHTDNDTYTWIKDRGDGIALATQTLEQRRIDYKGFSLNLAAQYAGKFKDYDWQANITYSPEIQWTTDNVTKLQTYDVYNPGRILDQMTMTDASKKMKNPQVLSLGTGIGKNMKWFVGGQFTYTENSKLSSSWNTSSIASFENSRRYSVGGFYIPKYYSYVSYFDRITYRAGLRYENTGLVLNNKSINDYALSAGFGFPIGRNGTNLNVGFEYGQRGTKSNDLIKENYFNMSVGFSLNDIWFKRRRFE